MRTTNSGFIRGWLRVAALAIIGLAIVLMPDLAEAGNRQKPKPKPKLRVTEMAFEGTSSPDIEVPTVVLPPTGKPPFALTYTITNVGKAKSDDSQADVVLGNADVFTTEFGSIGKGKSKHFKVTNEHFPLVLSGAGLYDITVCLGKRCAIPAEFWAVPRRWTIDAFSTTRPTNSVGKALTKTDQMAFEFDDFTSGTIAAPTFYWVATGGQITTDVDATQDDPPCTHAGHGVISHTPWDLNSPDIGNFSISPSTVGASDTYESYLHDEDYLFTVTRSCPGSPPEQSESKMAPLITECPGPTPACPMSLNGVETLAETIVSPSGYTTNWSFTADLP